MALRIQPVHGLGVPIERYVEMFRSAVFVRDPLQQLPDFRKTPSARDRMVKTLTDSMPAMRMVHSAGFSASRVVLLNSERLGAPVLITRTSGPSGSSSTFTASTPQNMRLKGIVSTFEGTDGCGGDFAVSPS